MSAQRIVFGIAAGSGLLTVLSSGAGAQQASRRDAQIAKDKKDIAKSTADAAKSQAEAARATADAAKATADAEKIKAETALAAQKAAGEDAERKRKADAAEAEKVRQSDAKVAEAKRADESKKFWLSLGSTVLGVGVGIVAGKLMGKAGAQAIINRGNAVGNGLNDLGAKAAQLLVAGRKAPPIAGSVAGDAAKGIVKVAGDLSKSKAAVGKPGALDVALPGLTLASGVAETAYSFVAPNDGIATASRAAGAASIIASLTAGKSLLTAHRMIVRPKAENLAALAGLSARLARETPKVARAVKAAPVARTAAVRTAATTQKSSGVVTYTRRYTTGPKAGIEETVTRRAR